MADTGAAAAGTGVGAFALVEGVLFIVILFLGLAYVWAKGDLDWVLAWERPALRSRPSRVRKKIELPARWWRSKKALAAGQEGSEGEGVEEGEGEAA